MAVPSYAKLPATCSPGDLCILTTTGSMYGCSVTNEWTPLSDTVVWGAISGTLANQTDLVAAIASGGSGSLPSGVIVMWSGLLSAIPSGWNLCDGTLGTPDLRDRFIVGAHAGQDPGATGGSNTHTHTITWPVSSPTFSGTAGTVPAQTFTGSSATTSATGAGTPAGTVSQPTFTGSALAGHAHELPFQIPSTTTTRQIAAATFGTGTSRAATAVSATGTANTTSAAVALSQSVSAGTPAGTVSQPTFTGAALAAHTHTLTAAGTNSSTSFTPAGTVAWPASVPTNDVQSNVPVYFALAFIMKA